MSEEKRFPAQVLAGSIATILFLALAFSARAQSPTAHITGVVLDAQTGAPVANARVNAAGAETFTDSRGAFTLANLAIAAPYELATIRVTAPGYGGWTMRDALLYPGVTRTLTIHLGLEDETIVAGLPRALTSDQPFDWRGNSPRVPRYYSNDILPLTIKVGITDYAHCGDWVSAGMPVKRVDVIDFKTYVKNVLPNEWYAAWGNDAPNSLRAGALAIKSFAWWRVNLGGVRPLGAEVVDNTCDQRYIPNTNDPRTDAAVDETWDYLMRRNAQVIEIHYLATVAQCQTSPYQPCMPQWGTYYDALDGMDWRAIAHRYYDPVAISPEWSFFPIIQK
ncbi:MAG: carboxypeptidase regulatory-like domain-containing protein [Chloroflexi bacterium]|nr:carboxypeptidase regulatory-like domain-containing protein [Chloroflexota bacterium]